MNQPLDRRSFLKSSAGAAAGAALPDVSNGIGTRILLWIPGGMAATEMFDPKEFVPYRRGLETWRVRTTVPSIPTALRGARIARGLERIAEVLDRATLVRTFTPRRGVPLAHGAHQRDWMDWFAAPGKPVVTPGDFASGCRAALQAVESGQTSVLVPYRFTPFAEWDTHEHGAARMEALRAELDAPVAELVRGLERRGLLRSTRVILASEFSREPVVEGGARLRSPSGYGVHAHAAESSSVVLFGGAGNGRVIGATSDDGTGKILSSAVDFARLRTLCE